MHELADKLNKELEGTEILSLLSDYGKRMYVPQGIIVQSQEARKKATKYMATIGVALENGNPMNIKAIRDQFGPSLSEKELFLYSPMGGNNALREKWLEDMKEKNPAMKNAETSLPIVTNGLTNGVSIASALFLNKGDCVIRPDKYWENYNLIFEEQIQADVKEFPLFRGTSFNIQGMKKAIENSGTEKVFLMLNFPNNPSGYTPTVKEMNETADMLTELAEKGKKIIVFCDDAYFGLFYTEDVCRQSLFALLCNRNKNIFVIKGDAATKEEMVWGFRIGFLTYGGKGLTKENFHALEQKTLGVIRGTISSCSTPAQNAILKGMNTKGYKEEKQKGIEKLKARFSAMKENLARYNNRKDFVPLPFNSGYFMSFFCTCDAEDLRQKLLNDYQTGVIRTDDHHIRIAFSSCDTEKISGLIDTLYKCSLELNNK